MRSESEKRNEFLIGVVIAFAALLLCRCTLEAGTEPVNVDTLNGHVKVSSSSVGLVSKPLDFSNVILAGIPGLGNQGNQLLSGGGVAWTGTGLNFIVSAAVYRIGGTQYSSPQTPITLATAHPTNDRIDVFAVTTSSTAVAITGTPGGPPLEPQVNPITQLRLTSAYIPAASGVPVITNVNLYLENTEWTSSTSSPGTINLASTNNPYAGTKDIEGTATGVGDKFDLVKPAAGTENLSNYASLVLQLRSKAAWPKQKSLSLFWLNGSTTIGTTVAIKDGTFGFDSSNTSSYQQIVIPISQFNTGSSLVTTLRVGVSGAGSTIGWYLDNIILQTGTSGGGPAGDFSTNVNVAVSGDFVQFSGTTGKLGTDGGLSRSTDGTLAGNSDVLIPSQKAVKTYVDAHAGISSVTSTIGFTTDGVGSVITTGNKGYFTIPFAGTITRWSITAVGSSPTCTIDVWKIGTGTALPTVANTIMGTKPALSTGNAIRSSTLTGWTTSFSAGDIFGFNVDAVTVATKITFALEVTH